MVEKKAMDKNYKVLIIDDEKPARTALRYLLGEWKMRNCSVLEAKNGTEGYQLFLRESPDIIILDINMPHLTGIEFLEKIENKIGDTKIIIISGYNEFKFAQKAIQYNVMGYLLKPINRQEFYSAMERIIEELERGFLMAQKVLQVDKGEKIRFFEKIISEVDYGAEETFWNIKDDFSKYTNFAVCTLHWNFWDDKDNRLELSNTELDNQKVIRFIEDFLQNKCNAVCFESKIRENILIIYGYENRKQLQNVLQVLQMGFLNKYRKKLLIADGNDVRTIDQLFQSYRTAKKNIGRRNLLPGENLIDEKSDSSADNIQSKNLLELYKVSIRNCYLKNDSQKLEHILKDMFVQMKSRNTCTINQAELLIRQFVIFIDEFYINSGESRASVLYFPDWQLWINQIISFEDFEKIMFLIAGMTINRLKHREIDLKWVLGDIRHHLENHYAQTLKLDELAERYSFSKQYLNKNFKKEYHCCIHEYLLQVRMERAKYLLLNTTMDINEIAASVGYTNQGYFGKVFKKYFNESPNSFRGKNDE